VFCDLTCAYIHDVDGQWVHEPAKAAFYAPNNLVAPELHHVLARATRTTMLWQLKDLAGALVLEGDLNGVDKFAMTDAYVVDEAVVQDPRGRGRVLIVEIISADPTGRPTPKKQHNLYSYPKVGFDVRIIDDPKNRICQ
jgi:hypothetical protein